MHPESLSRSFIPCIALGVLLSAQAACSRLDLERAHGQTGHDESGHAAAQEAEPKTAQLTVWTERHEIFLEHRFIVAGTPTTFVTHVTDLATLEPRREGPITLVLRSGTESPIEYLDPAPARAGIYTPALVFPEPGEWTVAIRIPMNVTEAMIEMPPFTVYGTPAEAAAAPEPKAPEGTTFLKEQAWKVKTRSEPVGTRRLVERLRLPGVVASLPAGRAAVTPPVPGQLMAPEAGSMPRVGDRVEAGQELARVRPPLAGSDHLTMTANRLALAAGRQQVELMKVDLAVKLAETEANAVQARAALEQADRTLARVQELFDRQAKSQRELEEVQFTRRVAQSSLEAAAAMQRSYKDASARLDAMFAAMPLHDGIEREYPWLPLRAPIAGTVIDVASAVGEHVEPDRPVFRLLDTGLVLVEARVSESDIGRVAATRDAVYERPDAPGVYAPILGDGRGRLIFLGPEVDPATRTVPLLYELGNALGHLRVGLALTVHVETAHAEEALALPVSALVDEDGRPTAWVQLAGETFEKRELVLGFRDGDQVQVLSGLVKGDRVVTRGAYAIRLASVSTTLPAHGHAH